MGCNVPEREKKGGASVGLRKDICETEGEPGSSSFKARESTPATADAPFSPCRAAAAVAFSRAGRPAVAATAPSASNTPPRPTGPPHYPPSRETPAMARPGPSHDAR
eukprot:363549-Chlamydomonas_euryale.AAC.7